jgi:hypothetical protein
MSIPFLSITCTCCDFRGSSFATTGRFLWSYKGKTFRFERRLGLCLDCNKIVAIEDLPDPKTMERARSIRRTYTGQPLLRLLEPDYAKYLASQVGFEVLEEVLALDRRPVCLECGKSAVRPIDIPEGVNSEVPVSLNLGHPWCAGMLQVQDSGALRMGVRAQIHVYSIHGQLISSYDEQG